MGASLEPRCSREHAFGRERADQDFPTDPQSQLEAAVAAVFKSWNNPRAKLYRSMHHIPEAWGTAVNVQAMVFGNLGDTSATDVAFTRDPSTGERRFFGEWLPNAQGEDVVAGTRTPRPLGKADEASGASLEEMLRHHSAPVLADGLQSRFAPVGDSRLALTLRRAAWSRITEWPGHDLSPIAPYITRGSCLRRRRHLGPIEIAADEVTSPDMN